MNILFLLFVFVHLFVGSISEIVDVVESDEEILGDHRQAFDDFKQRFNKTCADGTEICIARKRHFASNMDKLQELKDQNETNFGIGITRFMDWSPEEINTLFIPRDRMHQLKAKHRAPPLKEDRERQQKNAGEFDWRTTGAVSPIRNQGNCGCCWAFAAVAAIEVQYNHKNRYLNDKRKQYSEQYIVDCDTVDWGCGGGLPQSAMRFTQKTGLIPRSSYPYQGKRTKCRAKEFAPLKRHRPLKKVKMLTRNMPAIINFVRHQGPVAAGLWVCNDFMFYTHGVYDNQRCNGYNSLGGHAMAIIGFGTDNGKDYWLLRNQWGTDWGLNGYIKMARGVDTCRIESWGVSAPIM